MDGGAGEDGAAVEVFAVEVAVAEAECPLAADVLAQADFRAGVAGAADVLGLVAVAACAGAAAGVAGGFGDEGVLDFVAQAAVKHGGFCLRALPGLPFPAEFDVAGALGFEVGVGDGASHAEGVAVFDAGEAGFAGYGGVEHLVFYGAVAQFDQAVYGVGFAFLVAGGQFFGGEVLVVGTAAQPPLRGEVDLVFDGKLVGGIAEAGFFFLVVVAVGFVLVAEL